VASRDAILAALADTRRAPDPIGGFAGVPIRFPDPIAAFTGALAAAGGEVVSLPDRAALDAALAAADADTVVLAGGPAVAESGAVWWVPRSEDERRAAFLAERVWIAVAREELVDDLGAAYRRIDPAAAHYGCFMAGPSKTADIEQALVIGAHGPRALRVLLWGRGGRA
jgi:L-lactate dehydrogenase complex protein LldG